MCTFSFSLSQYTHILISDDPFDSEKPFEVMAKLLFPFDICIVVSHYISMILDFHTPINVSVNL